MICIQDVRTFNWWYNWDGYNSWMCKNKLIKKKGRKRRIFFLFETSFLNLSVKIKLIKSWLTYEWIIDRSLKLRGYKVTVKWNFIYFFKKSKHIETKNHIIEKFLNLIF